MAAILAAEVVSGPYNMTVVSTVMPLFNMASSISVSDYLFHKGASSNSLVFI